MIQITEIPDDTAELVPWLEHQLAGERLRDLIVELTALRLHVTGEQPIQKLDLDTVLGGHLAQVLESGLTAAPPGGLRRLLQNPSLLFELQEQILLNGGHHWQSVPTSPEQEAVAQSRRSLTAVLAKVLPNRSQKGRRLLTWFAIAASIVFIALFFNRNQRTGWGFNRSGLLTAKLTAHDYLNSLAEAAQEWSTKTPTNRDELAQRLQQFVGGCDTLIHAEHPQLKPIDRDWLRDKCESWKQKLQANLADLTSGRKSLGEAQKDANATVDKLIEALKNRADKV